MFQMLLEANGCWRGSRTATPPPPAPLPPVPLVPLVLPPPVPVAPLPPVPVTPLLPLDVLPPPWPPAPDVAAVEGEHALLARASAPRQSVCSGRPWLIMLTGSTSW